MARNEIAFKRSSIEAIKPVAGKRVYFYDTKTEGLELTVTPAGSKTFSLYKKWNGKPVRIFLGKYASIASQPREFERNPLCVLENRGPLTVEQARTLARAVLGQLASGRNPNEDRVIRSEEPTLEELFKEYIERHMKKSRKSWPELERCFERWFSDWKQRKAGTISDLEVEKLHGQLARTRGRYAANRAVQLLRAMYNKARQWKIFFGDNPVAGISLFSEEKRERILRQDEFERFFQALETCDYDFRDFVQMTLFTGQRKSNVMAMRWADIDLTAETWRVPGEQTKNGRSMVLALTAGEVETLKRRLGSAEEEYVFPGHGKTGHLVETKRAWAALLKAADITDLHIHDLRRSLASYMAEAGAELATIKSALNHKDMKTTLDVYVHTRKASQQAARSSAHDLMLRLAGRKNANIVSITPPETPALRAPI
jgi:integrase